VPEPTLLERQLNRSSMNKIDVLGLDHIVLNVEDVERSFAFYHEILGLESVRLQEWRAGTVPFPSVRVNAATIIDLVPLARTGENIDHLCLVVAAIDFERLTESDQLDVVSGPGRRFGARGDGTSLYVKDPDGNVVELKYYDH
jgi:catechol 2,3-dioxygenase-like lactoylglutathione lyase family enzyme